MLLTITTTHRPANDLGFLLHKHPERFQSFDLSFGKAHVYYPEVSAERCTACLLLDVDSVGMVRGKNGEQSFLLAHYVNDRPYTASSFMSVAIAQVFGSALQGRCKDRPELATTAIPLSARLDVLPVRGGERFLRAVFEPLGYAVEAIREFLRRGVVPERSRSAGRIICMSSVHEVIPWGGHANYAASKGGILMLMKTLSQEFAPHKIRVNSIGPGAIKTPINRAVWQTKAAEKKLLQLIPYERIGVVEDIAAAAVWLASDDSDYVNGTTLFVDGGMTLYPGFGTNG